MYSKETNSNGNNIVNNNEHYTIDILHIIKFITRRFWAIVISGILAAAIGFCISAFLITPKYASSIMLYVNNSSFSLGNTSFSISSSEITAAQSLVKTYGEILNNRTTLERVIEKAEVPYDYKQLSEMISASPSNDTEIMRVTVVSTDPKEAAKIANCIAEVLPMRIAEIVDGASMEVVDSAIPSRDKESPSITRYSAVGMVLGILFSCIILVILALLDNTIHDEEYVLKTYNYPILAKVPSLTSDIGGRQYQYYVKK